MFPFALAEIVLSIVVQRASAASHQSLVGRDWEDLRQILRIKPLAVILFQRVHHLFHGLLALFDQVFLIQNDENRVTPLEQVIELLVVGLRSRLFGVEHKDGSVRTIDLIIGDLFVSFEHAVQSRAVYQRHAIVQIRRIEKHLDRFDFLSDVVASGANEFLNILQCHVIAFLLVSAFVIDSDQWFACGALVDRAEKVDRCSSFRGE